MAENLPPTPAACAMDGICVLPILDFLSNIFLSLTYIVTSYLIVLFFIV